MNSMDSDPSTDEASKQAMPLEYARPMPRAGGGRDLVIGIFVSIALAVGVGCLTFGLMLSDAHTVTDQMAATFTAFGAALLALVAGLVATVLWLRFVRR